MKDSPVTWQVVGRVPSNIVVQCGRKAGSREGRVGYLCKPRGICGVCSASVPSCTRPDLPVPSARSHIFPYQVLDLCRTHLGWLSAFVRVLQGTVRERGRQRRTEGWKRMREILHYDEVTRSYGGREVPPSALYGWGPRKISCLIQTPKV